MPATEVKAPPEKVSEEAARWPGLDAGFFRTNWFNTPATSMMKRLSDEMERLFYGNRTEFGFWTPAVEIKEEPGKFRLMAELPGLKPEEVKVTVTEDAVTLQGDRKYEKEEKREGFYHTERSYGRFFRSIPLPKGADRAKVSAAFTNGVLEVTIPVPESKPKALKIPVKNGA